MTYTKDEVIQFVKEEDIKFIRLAFCDALGRMKNISIMPGEVTRAFETGIAIDASAVTGFGGEVWSDLFLHPDPATLSLLPWRPEHGGVVKMFSSLTYPDGRAFEADPRTVLKKTVKKAAEDSLLFSFGSELEFYLFLTDDEGKKTRIPFDTAGYMDIAPMDKGENVRREICLTLERMGIYPEASHHEEGPGQNEIDFKFSDPLSSADNAETFIWVVKTVAARNGLFADFSPKPMEGEPGNSFHINMSVTSLSGEKDLYPYMIGGIMEHIGEMTLFLNPTDESYNRLGKCKAPGFISWSPENRSQLIRIPAAEGSYKRIELRSPDPGTNPYIAFSLLISAAAEGIKNRIMPPEAANINLFSAPDEVIKKFSRLPETKEQAAKLAKDSAFIKSVLPEAVIKAYLK